VLLIIESFMPQDRTQAAGRVGRGVDR